MIILATFMFVCIFKTANIDQTRNYLLNIMGKNNINKILDSNL